MWTIWDCQFISWQIQHVSVLLLIQTWDLTRMQHTLTEPTLLSLCQVLLHLLSKVIVIRKQKKCNLVSIFNWNTNYELSCFKTFPVSIVSQPSESWCLGAIVFIFMNENHWSSEMLNILTTITKLVNEAFSFGAWRQSPCSLPKPLRMGLTTLYIPDDWWELSSSMSTVNLIAITIRIQSYIMRHLVNSAKGGRKSRWVRSRHCPCWSLLKQSGG